MHGRCPEAIQSSAINKSFHAILSAIRIGSGGAAIEAAGNIICVGYLSLIARFPMEELPGREIKIYVTWRGKTLEVMEEAGSTIGELGHKLQKLTNIAPDTMRLLVPRRRPSVPASLVPFSDQHSNLSLSEVGISEGQAIRMMGVFSAEIEEMSESARRSDLRIPGFLEEERRAQQRIANRADNPRKLPPGPYIFCDFCTLQLPGIELNPPAAKALEIMHTLASDPGIVAIMNKHRWRVGIMTELAPVGYVGISPKCILGFNKNHGEEISLRLRTDDLKGFRKYESIKKTLLHELAHMLHSEHDANFFALDKQLNQEAIALDWTKSKSHTVSGLRQSVGVHEVLSHESSKTYKLGGKPLHSLIDARASAASAALHRFLISAPTITSSVPEEGVGRKIINDVSENVLSVIEDEPDPDDCSKVSVQPKIRYGSDASKAVEQALLEPDPDDRESYDYMERKPDIDEKMRDEPDPDDCAVVSVQPKIRYGSDASKAVGQASSEPDPDDRESCDYMGGKPATDEKMQDEPDPDDCQEGNSIATAKLFAEPDPDDCKQSETMAEPDPDDSIIELTNDNVLSGIVIQASEKERDEPDPDDSLKTASYGGGANGSSATEMQCGIDNRRSVSNIITVDDPDLRRIQESTSATCMRLCEAIERLKQQTSSSVIQTLFTILRNVMDYPNEPKFRRLRKGNPKFQRCIGNSEAAIEVLLAVGFSEDISSDENGMGEAYLVLKRNDPGLLWLAKSSLEICIA